MEFLGFLLINDPRTGLRSVGITEGRQARLQELIDSWLSRRPSDLDESRGVRAEAEPKELTLEAVQAEVSRIGPAISAMGGVVEIVSVDPVGVAEIEFRGPNKVKQGLELALMDVPFMKHVKFVN